MAATGARCARAVSAAAPPLTVREIEWSREVEQALNDPAGRSCLPYLAQEVRAGAAQLWECSDGIDQLHVITRLDRNPTEWVMCYVRGSGVLKFGPHFVAVARAKGWPMRMHTQSATVARLARRIGARMHEYVLRWSHGPV